ANASAASASAAATGQPMQASRGRQSNRSARAGAPTRSKRPGHERDDQNSPMIFPSAPTSMLSAAGTLGRPGMVMISPQIATTNSAPADSRTSRTLMTWSTGAPLASGLVEKLNCVLAMQTGHLP